MVCLWKSLLENVHQKINWFIEVVKNPFAVGGGGAGWSVAYMLSEKGVDLVIAEKMGPNMKAALEERGVEFREVRGKVGKVIEGLGS